MSMPRPEYPRPQLERKEWLNLNGTWTYCFDFGKSGRESEVFIDGRSTGCHWGGAMSFCHDITDLVVCVRDETRSSRILLIPRYYADKQGRRFQVALYEGANQIAEREAAAVNGIPLEIPVENPQPSGRKESCNLKIEMQSKFFYIHDRGRL